ncbi:hypothetical protein [Dubosiella newyorkensis]|uniref:hypothetical protein n=1 Tax=Dubosiella newyorkensis TaxID=1862672 RepID=UPI003F66EF25
MPGDIAASRASGRTNIKVVRAWSEWRFVGGCECGTIGEFDFVNAIDFRACLVDYDLWLPRRRDPPRHGIQGMPEVLCLNKWSRDSFSCFEESRLSGGGSIIWNIKLEAGDLYKRYVRLLLEAMQAQKIVKTNFQVQPSESPMEYEKKLYLNCLATLRLEMLNRNGVLRYESEIAKIKRNGIERGGFGRKKGTERIV